MKTSSPTASRPYRPALRLAATQWHRQNREYDGRKRHAKAPLHFGNMLDVV